MANEHLEACTYRIVRYVPNLLRDEWINIGVLLLDRKRNRLFTRCLAEQEELARVRRIHPEADQQFLLAISSALAELLEVRPEEAAEQMDMERKIARLDESLSNVLQFGPQKAVLTDDAEGELERLYAAQVTPLPAGPRGGIARPDTRAGLRARASETFRRAGVLTRLERAVRIEEFTFAGDSFRMDYAYRTNGTRGFVHALPLLRDANQSKSLVFTAECVRERLRGAMFHAITEDEPRLEAERFHTLANFLRRQEVDVVPLAELPAFASRLGALVQ